MQLGPKALLVKPDLLVLRGLLVRLVLQVRRDLSVKPDLPVLRGLLVRLVPQVLRDLQVKRDLLVLRVLQAKMRKVNVRLSCLGQ